MTPSAILHIGPGAFHRAHQAVYADALIKAGHPEARIRGLCLFPPRIAHSLDAQKGAYHVLLRDGAGQELRRITSMGEVLDEPDQNFLSDPALRLVTMTLTEKGYCHIPGTRRLDPTAIAADLKDPLRPQTGIGWLALGLARRQEAGLPGLTLASCDNIPANGRLLQAVLSEFASQAWPALASWMAQNVTFPVSMVDRIVPRVDEEAARAIGQLAGAPDMLGVAAEPFGQWVLENDFAMPIPPLEKVGVQIVADVRPYEVMKHRILNGAQTAIAHLGALSGFETSFQAASDPVMGPWLARFCAAQAKTLTCPPGESLDAYVRTTLERLRNPHIRHPLVQIGTDSSFKLGQRIVEAAVCHLDGPEAELYALTIAAWMRYNTGRDANGAGIPVSDPLADRFRQINADAGGDAGALVQGFLDLDLFEGQLRHHRAFRDRLVTLCAVLERQSPRDLMMAAETSTAEVER
ncbi:mannitol dehydrogenase family protein [Paracoccus rhizosphaerae]|uniref:Mannitol dehydrogenase family protein n=1 Tax=Paracoccus rhizosphaerae TaxID=1133347 RepID=A0ABV6CHW7_9RHOB|nr:mannitol dehydrogenase family protein [Paracoccus rhizosphaerae]